MSGPQLVWAYVVAKPDTYILIHHFGRKNKSTEKMAWIWGLLSVFLFVYFLQKLVSPKNKKTLPPGPRGLPILGHTHLLGKNPHHNLYHLARKHGPIMGMRFGYVPAVIVSSAAAAELVLKTHDQVFASRPSNEAVKYFAYDQRNLVFAPYGPYWRNMRKLCISELLCTRRINQFQGMRRAEIRLLVASLKQAAEMRKTVDLSATISKLSGDMNCLMVFGRKYSDIEEFKDVITEALQLSGRFNLADSFPYIGKLFLVKTIIRMRKLGKIFDRFLEKIIDDHDKNKEEKTQNGDFVDTMMGIMESGKAGFEIDRRHVKAVLLDMLIAGMDTSATAVEWALSELIKNPPVMKKLQNELESVVGMGHMVDESHLDKLKYFDFVVKETFRLHPVVPLLLPHESTEDCVVDGFHIPKKTRVMVNVWAICRDPNSWSDPEVFMPERFINTDVDLMGQDFHLIPFGSGRRGCPGLQVGLIMVRLTVAQLVHCFNWELPNGVEPTDLDMSEQFGTAVTRVERLKAIPSYRLLI